MLDIQIAFSNYNTILNIKNEKMLKRYGKIVQR